MSLKIIRDRFCDSSGSNFQIQNDQVQKIPFSHQKRKFTVDGSIIVPTYAKVCLHNANCTYIQESVPTYAKVYLHKAKCTYIMQNVHAYAKMYMHMPKCTYICQSVPTMLKLLRRTLTVEGEYHCTAPIFTSQDSTVSLHTNNNIIFFFDQIQSC